ncbi:(2Fe-2S)-binding protein [Mycobacterium sp. Root265]|uniref:(2Fe-2S)-binding protein n=1 Tax=Mycobacterium sp. Root265 TaxID=1736504 RepID=UPI0009E72054|nr:(2Fe-2S)-binding protein [Mycobacterium sp. Root265]
MYVCLCTGATDTQVLDAIRGGASTSREVDEACGAGAQCGRCRRTVRTLLADSAPGAAPPDVIDR